MRYLPCVWRHSAGHTLLDTPGQRTTLGDGNTLDFTPIFALDGGLVGTTYSASFRLYDISTAPGHSALLPSGVFHIDFSPVPEPSDFGPAGSGL